MIWFFWLKGVWGLGSLTKDLNPYPMHCKVDP